MGNSYRPSELIGLSTLGASTAEAQERVAVEIAEQFLAISGISNKYTVTGIVNAPVLSAAMSGENGPWIELSKKLGQLGARFVKKNLSAPIASQTVGAGMLNKKFVHTAVLVGVLTGQTKNGLNLVNASTLAKDIGIEITEGHTEGDVDGVLVKVGQHKIKGKFIGNLECSLHSKLLDSQCYNTLYVH